MFEIKLANYFEFNIAKKMYLLGNLTFWDSTFVDALGPRDAIEIKSKSNTVHV